MSQELKDLVAYRLMRAKEAMDDAKILFENNKLFSTVNRIYYAMFYAVNGLLLLKGLSSAKHSGVLGLFNKEIVLPGMMGREWGKFYNAMFAFRQKADYKDFVTFETEDVKEWIDKGSEFIVMIDELIKAGGVDNKQI